MRNNNYFNLINFKVNEVLLFRIAIALYIHTMQ